MKKLCIFSSVLLSLRHQFQGTGFSIWMLFKSLLLEQYKRSVFCKAYGISNSRRASIPHTTLNFCVALLHLCRQPCASLWFPIHVFINVILCTFNLLVCCAWFIQNCMFVCRLERNKITRILSFGYPNLTLGCGNTGGLFRNSSGREHWL